MSELISILSPEGVYTPSDEYPLALDDEQLRVFYRDMFLLRRADAEATALQRQGQLALWAPSQGQEAAQIGAAHALRPQDVAFPTYREHGLLWVRSGDLIDALRFYRGCDQGGWGLRQYGVQPYTIVIGTQTLHAAGYAMGVVKDGAVASGDSESDTAVMAFLGDGAMSEGDVSEAMVFASVFDAPLVFFCQNNQYAISEPTRRQARVPLAQRAHGFGFPGVRVDGNDVLACYAVARVALERARAGGGPFFIEAFTYRMGPHTTSDDPTRYRDEAEVAVWRGRDPLTRYRTYLEESGLADPAFFSSVEKEVDEFAADLRARTLALGDPGPLDIFDHVYVEPSPELRAERAEFGEYLAGFEPAGGGA